MHRIQHLAIGLKTYTQKWWNATFQAVSSLWVKIFNIPTKFHNRNKSYNLGQKIFPKQNCIITLKNYLSHQGKKKQNNLITVFITSKTYLSKPLTQKWQNFIIKYCKTLFINILKICGRCILFFVDIFENRRKKNQFQQNKQKLKQIAQEINPIVHNHLQLQTPIKNWKPPKTLAEVSLPVFIQKANTATNISEISTLNRTETNSRYHLYKIYPRRHRRQFSAILYSIIYYLWIAPFIWLISTTLVLAPPTPANPRLRNAESIEDLNQAQDLLRKQLKQFANAVDLKSVRNSSQYQIVFQKYGNLLQDLEAVEGRIKIENIAKDSLNKANDFTQKANNLSKIEHNSVESKQQIYSLRKQAIKYLSQIPPDSFLAEEANQKFVEYKKYEEIALYELGIAKSAFLKKIAQSSGLSEQASITACNLSGDCRRLQGDRLPKSTASLSKIPIAIALLQKIYSQNISLDTTVTVQEGNYTEDAAQLRPGEKYSLGKLLDDMIALSSNIAPNQLIDYLGWDYINKVIQQQGYRYTRVSSKFMGENILPTAVGWNTNELTSNELTQMMVQIYNRQIPGADTLIASLNRQHDRELGFAALQGTTAKWLGEKTGQTSEVLGTTVAMEIAGKTYIVTVIDDGVYSDANLRNCITQIVKYIVVKGEI